MERRKEQRGKKSYAGSVSQYKEKMSIWGRKKYTGDAPFSSSKEPLPLLLPLPVPLTATANEKALVSPKVKVPRHSTSLGSSMRLLLITGIIKQNVLSLEDSWMSYSFCSIDEILNTLG